MKRTLALLVPAAVVSAVLVIAAVAVAASSPTVTTGTHSHVTDTTAVLHGTVNPNGSATTYYFQWGLTTAYGVQSVAHSAGHGTKAKAVSTTATALIPGTLYHYRLIATNGAGTTIGADHTFTTAGNPPPGVSTGPASQVSKNAATLTAEVSPNKQATSYYFQYGTSTSYGSQTIPATVPAGTVPVTVATAITGLEAQTIFHYRIVALHGNTRAAARERRDVHDTAAPPPAAQYQGQDDPEPRCPQAVHVHDVGSGHGAEVHPGDLRLPWKRERPLPARRTANRLDAPAAAAELQVLRADGVQPPAPQWSYTSAGTTDRSGSVRRKRLPDTPGRPRPRRSARASRGRSRRR